MLSHAQSKQGRVVHNLSPFIRSLNIFYSLNKSLKYMYTCMHTHIVLFCFCAVFQLSQCHSIPLIAIYLDSSSRTRHRTWSREKRKVQGTSIILNINCSVPCPFFHIAVVCHLASEFHCYYRQSNTTLLHNIIFENTIVLDSIEEVKIMCHCLNFKGGFGVR